MVVSGHRWWVLPEELSKGTQTDISLWRNMGQNENQAVHEIEILLTIKMAAMSFLPAGKDKVTLGDIASYAVKKTLPICPPRPGCT